MLREPAVAGQFYPADPAALREDIEQFLRLGAPAPADTPLQNIIALIVPHAGYVYSGKVAGAVYAAVELPRKLVILCPNHTGDGRPIAVMNRGAWRTPLGDAPIDEPLADRLLEGCRLAEIDHRAHQREHSLEVQIPFLQAKLGEFSFVPVSVGTHRLDDLTRLGHDLAAALAEVPAAIVISSDMSHYIQADEARSRDTMAIERITSIDPPGLHRVVHTHDISMCGVAPAVAGLTAAKDAGARSARLIAYANSGDTSGDYESVVAYAGLTIS